ncbi:reverse transcriptase/ribonuclease H [Ixodes scapularis]
MLNTGAVQESQSPWASPVVLAPKKDGLVRLCVDYRHLNAVTVRDPYPFPSIDSVMYAIGNAKVFTTLDCSQGFLQIEIDPEDVPKTALTCHRGLFEFTRLPFSLSNSPASFQRLMDIVLGDTKYKFAKAYMDDVIIFSQTFEEHLKHLGIVLERLRNAGLTIHPDKVQLASPQINLLGFVVDNGVLCPNEDKLHAITEYPQPHDVKSLQRFLGLIGFYRQFIPRCAEITNPLTLLLRKGEKWRGGEDQRVAFLQLLKAITDVASLKLPDLNRQFVVQTDASNSGLGAVLLQEHNNVLRPVAFASRTLTAAGRNYSVTEKECLAIIFALKKFNMYLDGASFQIQTDHQALFWLKNLQNPAGRLARWALTLQAYDYTIAYRKRATNIVADALSRVALQVPPTETEPKLVGLTDIVARTSESRWGTLVSRADLRKAQQEDGLRRRVCERLAARRASGTGSDDEYDSYLLSEDGLLLRYIPQADDDSDGSPFRIVIPRKLPKSFIRYFHDSH